MNICMKIPVMTNNSQWLEYKKKRKLCTVSLSGFVLNCKSGNNQTYFSCCQIYSHFYYFYASLKSQIWLVRCSSLLQENVKWFGSTVTGLPLNGSIRIMLNGHILQLAQSLNYRFLVPLFLMSPSFYSYISCLSLCSSRSLSLSASLGFSVGL